MFFPLSKLFWYIATPSTLLLLGFCLSRSRSRILIAITLVLLVLPIGDWVIVPWEHKIEPAKIDHVDGIIVLGGAIADLVTRGENQVALKSSAERVTSLISLMQDYPKAKVLFSGGSGDIRYPDLIEADDAKRLFQQWHLPMARISYERKSRNTYENAVYSQAMVKPKADEKWLLVTSAAHMPRSKAIFDKIGWNVLPYPVDYSGELHPSPLCFCLRDNLTKIDMLVHEFIGLQIYRWTGKA